MVEISVIMLVYNREQYVAKAIESILNQTFQPYEFIIVDNGSTDASGAICDDYAKKSDKIKVIHRERGNIGSGRNAGLDMARGKYITYIDDDDTAEPEMLEFLYSMIQAHDADIALCGSYVNEQGISRDNCVFDELLVMDAKDAVIELLNRKKYNVAMPTKLLKRTMFSDIRFDHTGKYDDITTVYRFFANARKVVAHGVPHYTFYRHGNNNSSFTTNDLLLTPAQLNEYFEAFKDRTAYLSDVLPEISDFARYTEWSYMISMCNKIESHRLEHCFDQLKHIQSTLIRHYDEFYNSPYLKDFEKTWMDRYIKPVMEVWN